MFATDSTKFRPLCVHVYNSISCLESCRVLTYSYLHMHVSIGQARAYVYELVHYVVDLQTINE